MVFWVVAESSREQDKLLVDKLMEFAEQDGLDAKLVYIEELDISKVTTWPRVALLRGYSLELYAALQKNGVYCINNDFCMRSCWDKIATFKLLDKHGIKMPKTLFFKHAVTYDEMKKELGLPLIVKDRFGGYGNDVYLVNNEAEFEEAAKNIDVRRIMYQEFIAESRGIDFRFMILGGRIIAEFQRTCVNDFRSNNVVAGRVCEKKDFITEEHRAEALKIAELLKADFVSVDYLVRGTELIFLEANSSLGVKPFHYDLGYDIPKEVYNYVKTILAKHSTDA